ncbi:MAG: hypothetical protein OK455_11210 [Thaumarchaeota archaeon]|nr:hypothetical protein [Nitrososphaerota archaeon]
MTQEDEPPLIERERKLAALGSLVEFAESWKVDELCARFRAISEPIFSETLELRLVCALVQASEPLHLSKIAERCGVSRELVLSGGRVRRALGRMERAGLVLNVGREGRPRYCLDRSNSAVRLLEKIFKA